MKNLLLTGLVSVFCGLLIGWWAKPTPKPETKVEYKDKVVTQTQERVIEKVVKEPGGTVTVTKEVIRDIARQEDKKGSQSVSKPSPIPSYRATVSVDPSLDLRAVGAEMRLFGPVWGGATVTRDRDLLIHLSYEF
jgi:hypothetical protein